MKTLPEHVLVGITTRCTNVSGLGLISPEDAMKLLMSKWIVQALLPGMSNLQIILQYRITKLQPSNHGPWGPSSLWLFTPNFSTKGRSRVWHHITQSWKRMANTVAYLSSSTAEDILQTNLWWRTKYQCLHFDITMSKAIIFYHKGLRYPKTFGTLGDIISWIGTPPKSISPLKRFTMIFGSN